MFGLITRQQRWGLSLKGWVLLISLIVTASGAVFLTIFPFLAVSAPEETEFLIVEGWIPLYAIKQTAAIITNSPNYKYICTTG